MLKKRIHFVGVGGIAMSGLACMFKQKGWEVSGSDSALPYPPSSDILKECDINVKYPYDPKNIPDRVKYCVIGNVIRRSNPEAEAIEQKGLKYISMPQALMRFFGRGKRRVVVAGTHGKTTTTGMLLHVMKGIDLDPTGMVGGVLQDYGRNYMIGKGDFFVVEGDEYDTAYFDKTPKFLHYKPHYLILTNIEFDHADIFQNLDVVKGWFKKLVRMVPRDGLIVAPAEDENVQDVLTVAKAPVVTYGLEKGDFLAEYPVFDKNGISFILTQNGFSIGEFKSRLLGVHNLRNTLAVMSLLISLEMFHDNLPQALNSYKGVARRQQLLGEVNGALVFDDFAHHPTAVRETIRAIKKAYPDKNVIALFEPESNTSRRKVFQDDFVEAFKEAKEAYFIPPLKKNDNLPEEERLDINKVVKNLNDAGINSRVFEQVNELADFIKGHVTSSDIVLIMSGRDFKGLTGLLFN